ncbi:hypothetical protein BH23PAT1_BH23PAT1_5090 [soil metagenome]
MPRGQRLRLDNPVFEGRLRGSSSAQAGPVSRGNYGASYGQSPARRHGSAISKRQKTAVTTQAPSVPLERSGGRVQVAPQVKAAFAPTQASPTNNQKTEPKQSVGQHVPEDRKKPKFSVKRQQVFTLMAVLVFIFGVAASLHSFKTDKDVQAQVAELSEPAAPNEDTPDETDIPRDVVYSYSVAPDLPRLISIHKSGVSARIQRVGVKPNNELAVPRNTNDTGWYEGSAKPGENGAMLIVGHASGLTQPGVFHNLKNLIAGDMINVERGDGQNFRYKVVKSEVYAKDKVDMTKALVSIKPGKKGLNLITCDGRYDAKTETYDKRMVVYAVQE